MKSNYSIHHVTIMSPSTKDALYQVLLQLVQRFLRRHNYIFFFTILLFLGIPIEKDLTHHLIKQEFPQARMDCA